MGQAYEIPGFSFGTLAAAADWSTGHGAHRFASISSAGKVIYPTAGGRAIATRHGAPRADEACTLVSTGIVMLEAGEEITVGSPIETDATGRALEADTGQVLGTALTGAGAAGELFACLLELGGTGSGTVTQRSVFSFPIALAGSSRDLLTAWTPGFAGTIESVALMVTTATTDGDAEATINLEIGSTNLTGGVISVADTAAGATAATPAGKVLAGTAITAGNVFTDTDTISIEYVVTTAFTDGEGLVVVTVAG